MADRDVSTRALNLLARQGYTTLRVAQSRPPDELLSRRGFGPSHLAWLRSQTEHLDAPLEEECRRRYFARDGHRPLAQECLRRREAGESTREIAASVGHTPSWVNALFRGARIYRDEP